MIEAIFLFFVKVLVVLFCIVVTLAPIVVAFMFCYGLYKDLFCSPNKAKSTRDKISAWFFILISSSHKASAYHPTKSLPLPAVGSMCRFERMSAQAFINPSLSSFPSGTSPPQQVRRYTFFRLAAAPVSAVLSCAMDLLLSNTAVKYLYSCFLFCHSLNGV